MRFIDLIRIDGEHSEDANGQQLRAEDVYRADPLRESEWWSPSRRGEWVAERYERIVLRLLRDDIFPTISGRALRSALLRRTVTIMPWPERRRGSYQAQALPVGSTLLSCPAGEHPYRRDGTQSPLVCLGGGTAVTVKFTPAHFGPPRSGPRGRDAVLFHELVHAVRYMDGKFQAHPAYSRERYTNVEEFYAVVVTNVYLSERGAPLRWGHRDSTTLLTNPDTWLNHERNRNLVARFQREQALFAVGLARSPASFNPFRQLS